jgi:hypothetical protein
MPRGVGAGGRGGQLQWRMDTTPVDRQKHTVRHPEGEEAKMFGSKL